MRAKKSYIFTFCVLCMLALAACEKEEDRSCLVESNSEILKNYDESDNPYFNPEIDNIEYSYCEELLFGGKVKWDTELLEGSEYGILYNMGFSQVEGSAYCYVDSDEGFYTDMIHGGWEWFFWVTDSSIYYINDMSDEEEDLLIDSGKLPSNALLVCHEELFSDELSVGEVGDHEWLEEHDGDIICYRSFSINYNEPGDLLQFVWKKDVGLIGFRFARTPAGGGSLIIWDPQYLQKEEVGFDIDRMVY